jgi:hypothetical protein
LILLTKSVKGWGLNELSFVLLVRVGLTGSISAQSTLAELMSFFFFLGGV